MEEKRYTEAPIDILEMSIPEIQETVDLGIINYETIARIYLERIEEYNDDFTAVISVNKNIIEQAKKLDEEYELTGRRSELFGIPIILKDNIDYVGMPTTAGAKGLADNYPKTNSDIAQNLVDAGALIIGKANMSEFAFSAAISKSSYGTVKNAYNTGYTSYGSSGGTAVAVSTGMAVAGVGTDTNSSIRVPSSAANLIGLRPTYGLLSAEGIIKYDASRDTAGPMTKYSADNELLLGIMAGNKDYTKNEVDVENLKIGVLTQFVNGDSSINLPAVSNTSAVVLDLFNATIDELEEAGIEIVEIPDFYSYTVYNYYYNTIGGWTMCYFFNKYIKNTTSSVKSFTALVNKGGYIQALRDYESRCNDSINKFNTYTEKNAKYADYVKNKMDKYDVDLLVYPTTKNEITKLSNASIKSPSSTISPVTGFPAISIPMGFGKNNLPYGIEFVAKANEEHLLYAITELLEDEEDVKISELAPALYEVGEKTDDLVELYRTNQDTLEKIEYKEVNEEIQNFFDEYNYVENKELTASTLIDKYNDVVEQALLNEAKKERNAKHVTIALVFALFLAIIGRCIKSKNKKKSKKKKKSRKAARKTRGKY